MDDLDRDEDKGKDPEDAPRAPRDWPKIGGEKTPAEPTDDDTLAGNPPTDAVTEP